MTWLDRITLSFLVTCSLAFQSTKDKIEPGETSGNTQAWKYMYSQISLYRNLRNTGVQSCVLAAPVEAPDSLGTRNSQFLPKNRTLGILDFTDSEH